MKYIKRLVLTMIPVVFLMGCSASNMKTKNVSKEAIERNTMTKVQSDVNVIMNKSDDYVLQNMGSPYSTIYSLKIDKVKNFEDLKKMVDKNMDDVEILSKGLLYPKYTSDYNLDGSALYIALKNNKVNEVETCDFKNLDVSSLMDEKANAVISAYTDYNSLSSENIKKEKLNKYIGEDKSSISSITKNKIAKIVGIIKIIPPIVGVPSFFLWDSPTYSLILWPKLILFKNGINIKPTITAAIKPIIKDKIDLVSNNI